MAKDRVGENIRHKVFMCMMRCEKAATVGMVDDETVAEIREVSRRLSVFQPFRDAYAAKKGAGALWLDRMIHEAQKPYPPGPIEKRELWVWTDRVMSCPAVH